MTKRSVNNWKVRKKTKDVVLSYEMKQKGKYIKGSIIAIVLGLVLAGIIIAIQNVNPFEYLKYLFDISFNNLYRDQTFQWLSIYIVAALAVAIGFKSGIFNIGVSGQMLLGSGVSVIYYKLGIADKGMTLEVGNIILILLICIFSGAFLAGIAGVLKALFNIHEVVTTIMLNWTIWYLLKFIFVKYSTKIGGPGISTSTTMPADQLTVGGSSILIPIIIALICLMIVAILLSKTVFGYKLKSVGSSTSASKYAGFNVKAKIIQVMLISGGLAGVASFINVFTLEPNLTFTIDTLPAIGYDSIAISLVAFNNPIGIFFTGFLWAILQSGGSSTASLFNLPNQMSSLIFGVIVYFAAISVVFINYRPILKLKYNLALNESKIQKIKIKELHHEQNKYRIQLLNINKVDDIKTYKEFIETEKNNLNKNSKEYKQLNKQMKMFMKEYKKDLKNRISKISNEIEVIKKDTYINRISTAKKGIAKRNFDSIKQVEILALKDISISESTYLQNKDDLENQLQNKKYWLTISKSNLKKELNKKMRANDVWLEGTVGEKTHYYAMFNGTVEIKGEIKKAKLKMEMKLASLKADYRMERLTIFSSSRKKREIFKLKREYKIQAKQTVQIFKEYKNEQESNVKRLKNEHYEIKRDLKNNTNILKEIKDQYNLNKNELLNQYEKDLFKINQLNNDKKEFVDNKLFKEEISQVKSLINEYKKNKTSNNELEKQRILKLNNEISTIWNVKFSDHSSKLNLNKQYRIWIYLEKELRDNSKEKIVLNASEKIEKIKYISNLVLKQYEDKIISFNKKYKNSKKQIIKNNLLSESERKEYLAIEQEKININFEHFIKKMEQAITEEVSL